MGAGLPARAHRAPQEAARRPAVAAQPERRRGRARPARRMVRRGRRRGCARRAPPEQRVREGVRRQTVIWRQLLAGDKEPEAYLDRHARAGAARRPARADLAPLPALVGRPPRRVALAVRSCACRTCGGVARRSWRRRRARDHEGVRPADRPRAPGPVVAAAVGPRARAEGGRGDADARRRAAAARARARGSAPAVPARVGAAGRRRRPQAARLSRIRRRRATRRPPGDRRGR